ncbi:MULTISPECIES: hypothetical protein [unclassified Enterococcus]|uniref:hypothetical protein n=1 Tax=unclassified Enterococcus TaxID=2608891 RepID=UPI001CE0E655|nr:MULTISPECIES: hypothetical protein [unclassified Enterococcus]MCA5013108.1 hypothetical protein [Enterococcus sp. S23]MCA5016358.1 hypothetical protein [Enterococcus sp. S22(2020)]
MKDAGKQIKHDETGYALLYTLGAIILVSLVMMGIFIHARNNFLQISAVDQITKMKDIKEYALQEASFKVNQLIQTKVSENTELGKGRNKQEDAANLKKTMLEVADELENQIKQENIGKNQDFSYEVLIDKTPTVTATDEVYKFISDDDTGENGWLKAQASSDTKGITNTKTTFSLEVKVKQTGKNGQEKRTAAKADYVYEFQWEKKLQIDEEQQLDSWRYVYYEAPLTSGDKYLSADTWIRKMDRIYRYQKQPLDFPYDDFDHRTASTFGRSNNFLVDYKDQQLLDFLNAKPISNEVTFDGSFFLNQGVLLRGKSNAQLSTNNLLYLGSETDPSAGKNLIKELNVTADTGIYIHMPVESNDAGLYIDNDLQEIKTPNLLINHTGKNKKTNGFFLARGTILLDKGTTNSNFTEYAGDSKKNNPQDKYWSEFMNGGLVISGSQVHLTPTDNTIKIEGVSVNSGSNDTRKIQVKNGHFMLTSAAMKDGGESDFAYADQGDYTSKPRQPALLELSGSKTELTVENGVSFIDAPKMRRRSDGQKKGSYYNDKKWWNTIRLSDKSKLDLGTVGVEPFNLEMEEDTVVAMELLPNLTLFDPTFIEKGFNKTKPTIKGKLILKTATAEDTVELKNMLEGLGDIPLNVKSDEQDAVNGEVTIVSPTVPKNPNADWVAQRVFDYSELK